MAARVEFNIDTQSRSGLRIEEDVVHNLSRAGDNGRSHVKDVIMKTHLPSFVSHLASGAVGGLIVMAALMPHMANGAGTAQDTISAHKFYVVDSHGNNVGYFGAGVEDDLPSLTLQKGGFTASLAIEPANSNPKEAGMTVLQMGAKHSKFRAATKEKASTVFCYGGDEPHAGVLMGCDQDGPGVSVTGQKGHVIVLNAASNDDSMVIIGHVEKENKQTGRKMTRPTGSILVLGKDSHKIWSMPPE